MNKEKQGKLFEIYGTDEPQPKGLRLQAGKLSATLSVGALADIRYDGIEILRGISYLVRDQDWGTCAAVISSQEVVNSNDGCEVRFIAQMQNGGSKITCFAQIVVTETALTFETTALPDKDFQTNRTGFVVLHPISGVAGKPVTVTHTDGTTTRSRFPKDISPGQPFFNIRALQHSPIAGLKAHVLLEGPKFEMEDQRNWGDASFKTYVCSLLDPWPYVLKAGERFTQRVTLSLAAAAIAPQPERGSRIVAKLRPNALMPEIGLSLTQEDAAETLRHSASLKQLAPKYLLGLVEVGKTSQETIQSYATICNGTGIPFRAEIVLTATQGAMPEMAEVAHAFQRVALRPDAVTVTHAHDLKSFQPSDERPWGPSYEEMAQAARAQFPHAEIGGGMISYFTELNRKRPPLGVFDYITHAICPIVHDAGDGAVMQTLETLPHIFESARRLMGVAPYHLGPSTIAARMNPYGRAVASNPSRSRMCLAPNDPRQFGQFGAVWTLGLLAAAAQARLASVTLGPLTGPRGLLKDDGAFSPLGELLMHAVPMARKKVHAATASGIVTLGYGGTVLLGNTTDAPDGITIAGTAFPLEPHDWQLAKIG